MLSLSVLISLISNAVAIRRDKSILYSRNAMSMLAICFIISVISLCTEFQGKGLGLFGGLYHDTVISHMFQIFIIIITFLVIQLNSFYHTRTRSLHVNTKNFNNIYPGLISKLNYLNFLKLNRTSQQYKIIEYPLVILFVLIGGVLLMSSYDIMSIFISIELQSYALYILCAIYRDSERATSAGLTYFLLGGLSSCFILLGLGLLYSNSGNSGFDGLYILNSIINAEDSIELFEPREVWPKSDLDTWSFLFSTNNHINFALSFMSVGFLFKISAAPFHFWSPDVYDAIPTVVTTFVAVFAKITILVLLLELSYYTTNMFTLTNPFESLLEVGNLNGNRYWTFTFLISSFLSLIIGSVLGLTQSRIKRLYAYSTIAHLGFLLLALTINSMESIQSFIFYLMQYSISNLNSFMLLIAIGYTLYQYSNKKENTESEGDNKINDIKETGYLAGDRNNSPIQLITDIKGFFYINPMLSLSLAITLFSFVGVPPLIGFFAKQMVLTSALDNGYVFMALIGILTSVMSAVYYLVLVRQMFFYKTDLVLDTNITQSKINTNVNGVEKVNIENTVHPKDYSLHLVSNLTTTISILTLITLFFMIFPQEWLHMTTILTLIIFDS